MEKRNPREGRKRKAIAVLLAAVVLAMVAVIFYFFARIGHISQGQAGDSELGIPTKLFCPPNWQDQAAAYEEKQKESLSRFLSTRRLVETDTASDLILWDTPKGLFWTDANDGQANELPWELASIESGLYDEGEVSVRRDDVVLDCGAHFGSFTRHALDRGAKLVVAIEFDPQSIVCLSRTFKSEMDDKKVIIYPKGVWDKDDTLMLYRAEKSGGSSVVIKNENTGTTVQLTTIDSLTRELRLPRVDFIKMDIEGAEQKAIIGAHETIAAYRPRMAIASYHKNSDPFVLPRTVREINPKYWVSMPRCWLRPWVKEPEPTADIIFFQTL